MLCSADWYLSQINPVHAPPSHILQTPLNIDIYIYMLIVVGLTPSGISTVHIYTQTVYRTTQLIHRTTQLSSYLKDLPSGLFPSGFPTKTLYAPHPLPHTCYMALTYNSSWFDHPNNIWWRVQINELLHSCVTASLLCRNILLSTLLSNIGPLKQHLSVGHFDTDVHSWHEICSLSSLSLVLQGLDNLIAPWNRCLNRQCDFCLKNSRNICLPCGKEVSLSPSCTCIWVRYIVRSERAVRNITLFLLFDD
jgi:hypothetical protein